MASRLDPASGWEVKRVKREAGRERLKQQGYKKNEKLGREAHELENFKVGVLLRRAESHYPGTEFGGQQTL